MTVGQRNHSRIFSKLWILKEGAVNTEEIDDEHLNWGRVHVLAGSF